MCCDFCSRLKVRIFFRAIRNEEGKRNKNGRKEGAEDKQLKKIEKEQEEGRIFFQGKNLPTGEEERMEGEKKERKDH